MAHDFDGPSVASLFQSSSFTSSGTLRRRIWTSGLSSDVGANAPVSLSRGVRACMTGIACDSTVSCSFIRVVGGPLRFPFGYLGCFVALDCQSMYKIVSEKATTTATESANKTFYTGHAYQTCVSGQAEQVGIGDRRTHSSLHPFLSATHQAAPPEQMTLSILLTTAVRAFLSLHCCCAASSALSGICCFGNRLEGDVRVPAKRELIVYDKGFRFFLINAAVPSSLRDHCEIS